MGTESRDSAGSVYIKTHIGPKTPALTMVAVIDALCPSLLIENGLGFVDARANLPSAASQCQPQLLLRTNPPARRPRQIIPPLRLTVALNPSRLLEADLFGHGGRGRWGPVGRITQFNLI